MKLLAVALLLLISDIVITYLFDIGFSLFRNSENSRIFDLNPFRVIAGRFILYFFIAGWAYLVAVGIYHLYWRINSLQRYFVYLILFTTAFYLIVSLAFKGISFYLIGYFTTVILIYYIFAKGLFISNFKVKSASVLYVIFLLFFYFYWLAEERDMIVLLKHALIYIPLAWIGQEIYFYFFGGDSIKLADKNAI